MKKRRKGFRSPVGTTLLFMAALLLLMTGAIGGVRATPQIFNPDFYYGGLEMDEIGVTLMENGIAVSNRDYSKESESFVGTVKGTLLANLLPSGEHVKPGYPYDEVLTVYNSGAIPTCVRVTVYRYWVDENGNKYDGLPTGLIDLHYTADSGWLHDSSSDTNERTVYYYSSVLGSGETTAPLTDTLTIGSGILDYAEKHLTKLDDGTELYTTSWVADGKSIRIEAEVNAVQNHNLSSAVKSAWGLTDGEIRAIGLNLGD